MPRRARQAPGGLVYHVLNRAVGKMRLFSKDADYVAFQKVMVEAQKRCPMRLLAYTLMPNHWHMVLWPHRDGELSRFMHWLTMTHTQRWRHHRHLVGLGPLYQGRFRAFPAQSDAHLLVVLRYVERNALRARLVQRAQDWPYSSLSDRLSAAELERGTGALSHSSAAPRPLPALCDWPIAVPRDYLDLVNEPQTASEEQALRTSVQRGRPFGDPAWQDRMIKALDLRSSVNPPHRPRLHPPSVEPTRGK